MTTTIAMLDAALDYAGRRKPVFPVYGVAAGRCACGRSPCGEGNRNAGKHPHGRLAPNGFKDATLDESTVREWWTDAPESNIATPTTWCVVLDVDPRHGGDNTLAELERLHGPLPDTAEVLTGGGGRHLYFAPVPGLQCKNGIAPGLDLKAEGGYVLLPPSNHASGRQYLDEILHPLFDTPLAPAPAWLLALTIGPAQRNGQQPAGTETDWGALLRGASIGQRRANALRIAGHFLGKREAPGTVVEILLAFGRQCSPPYDEEEDFRRIVRDLAAKNAASTTPAADPPIDDGLGLLALGELLGEPDSGPAWVVKDRLPAAGLGLFAGKPKAGKSTGARSLALHVARGQPWLGFATTQGPVIYLALEEKRQEVRDHFRAMGATSDDPIFIRFAAAPHDALARLRVEAERRRPVLIIVDPLFKLVRVTAELGNDYAAMTAALEPLLALARETGAHVLAVHHLGKGGRDDGDAILGSTAIFAAVDTALLMRRAGRYRTLSSIQRYGTDLEELTVALDPLTGDVTAGPPRAEAEAADAGRLILEFLAGKTEPVTEAEIADAIECRTQIQRKALRELVGTRIFKTGRGGKTDPFKYSCSSTMSGTTEQERLFRA